MSKIDFNRQVGNFKSTFILFALLQEPFAQCILFQIFSFILYSIIYNHYFKNVFFKLFDTTEKLAFCVILPLSHYLISTILSRGKFAYCDEKVDLKGKVAVVTGGYKGIGLEISLGLASLGCNVVMLGRDQAKGDEIVKIYTESHSTAENSLNFVSIDLDNFDSIRKAAEEIIKKYKNVDYIINNAGISRSDDDKENPKSLSKHFSKDKVYSTNVIGHYFFTELLLPVLNEQGRVINMSSITNLFYKPHSKLRRASYYKSKLANIQHTVILQRKFIAAGKDCNAYSCAPGIVLTELNTNIYKESYRLLNLLYGYAVKKLGKTTKEAAQIVIFLCISPDYRLDGGSYYNNMQIGYTSKYASDPKSQEELYNKAEKLYKKLYTKSKD